MNKCPLCGNSVVSLHKRSHILPEWMYHGYYDPNHKLVNVALKNGHINKRQKGIYAKIICQDCETKSQIYDRYASMILTERAIDSLEYKTISRKRIKKSDGIKTHIYTNWSNIDFIKFQRFVFACVLRTHLLNLQEGKPLLIEKHYNAISKIYRDENIIDDKSYPIMVMKFPGDDDYREIIYLPFAKKVQGHFVIDFSGAGYFFWVYVSNHTKPAVAKSLGLNKDGNMVVMEIYHKDTGTFRDTAPVIIDLVKQYPHI